MNTLSHHIAIPAAALAASVALAACGSSASSGSDTGAGTPAKTATTTAAGTRAPVTTTPATSAKVSIRNYMFSPMSVEVKAGARITFTNEDQTAHTATSDTSGFDTGAIKPGHSATITLSKPGVYHYHCSFHAFMVATITVVK